MWQMQEESHSIEIVVKGNFPKGEMEQMRLKIFGDGAIDHFVETFRAALVAYGFETDTAKRLNLTDE